MKRAMNREERINARVAAMKAHRKSVQRKKAVPVIVSTVCAFALLAGGTVVGVSLINSNKTAPAKTVQTTVAAKNANAQNTNTQNTNRQTAAVNADIQSPQTDNNYVQNTSSYSDCYNVTSYDGGSDNNTYTYDYNYSYDNSGSDSRQTAYTGTHHSGATWDGTGSPLHFYENGKTTEGYNWRYEGGNGLVDLGCDYTFDGHDYDFSLIGKAPGSGSITVWHNTDDNTQVPTTINFTVDDNLNVTYD